MERGGAVFVDVIPQNNVVSSVTVLRRFDDSPYTDDHGISFGMSSAAVRAKLGAPTRQSTNADDGSVDVWYVQADTALIYEFYGDKLGFVQIVARPGSQLRRGSDEPLVVPADGSSTANAIRIRPPNLLGNTMWIDAFMAMNDCGDNGHWKETSSQLQPDSAAKDLLAYTVVHAKCTSGDTERTFYFDTRGAPTKSTQSGTQDTIYVDVRQLQAPRHPSPSSSATPQ
jgi:hypothetical protein